MLERPTNPLLQAVYLVVGALLLIGALVMGAVILAFVLGFALVFGIVFWIRLWWLRRKLMRGSGAAARRVDRAQEGDLIEVEYTVVEERDPRDARDRRDRDAQAARDRHGPGAHDARDRRD